MTRAVARLRRSTCWRYARLALAASALPLALWACTSHPLQQPEPQPEKEVDQYYEVNPIRDVDIMFMIDNSPSMKDKQENLARNFPIFMDVLKNIPGGLPNVHVGIVSSDVGAGPSPVACQATGRCQCNPGGDRGVLYGAEKLPTCGIMDPKGHFLSSSNMGTMNNFTGDISAAFSCMARGVGDVGCGQEHQLQSIRVGLYEMTTPENKGFLRPNAYLAIILLTDEDDCSAPPNSDLFTWKTDGYTDSWRCAYWGHECAGKMPTMGKFATPLDNCTTNDTPVDNGGKLIPVQEFVNDIRRVKPRPDQQIIVAAVTGLPDDPKTAQYKYDLVMPDGGGTPAIDYLPVCQNMRNGKATASIRIKKFVDSFGPNGSVHSICADEFKDAMKNIADKLASKLTTPCIEEPLIDTQPSMPGVQPDCAVSDKVPAAGGGYTETPLPKCSSGAMPCWDLVADPMCTTSGFKMSVKRPGNGMAAPGTVQSIKCQVCNGPTDARCKK